MVLVRVVYLVCPFCLLTPATGRGHAISGGRPSKRHIVAFYAGFG